MRERKKKLVLGDLQASNWHNFTSLKECKNVKKIIEVCAVYLSFNQPEG